MQKEKIRIIKLNIPARKATPMPPIGTTLGQHGINISEFCKKFNDRSQIYEETLLLPVWLTLYKDKSFDFIIKLPTTTTLLKAICLGSAKFTISVEDIYKVSAVKSLESNLSLNAIFKEVVGTARSMGLMIQV